MRLELQETLGKGKGGVEGAENKSQKKIGPK